MVAVLLAVPVNAQGVRFEDVTGSSGVEATLTSGTIAKEFLVETMGGGLCVLDFDGDDWPDLFFANGTDRANWNSGQGPSDQLFRNSGDGRFSDVTDLSGVGESRWGMGCAAADFDADGDTDLYVTNYGANRLLRNDGGRFVDVTDEAAVGDSSWSTGAAFADYDGDGDLDLYVANYVDFDFENPGGDPRFCSYRGVTVACGPRGLAGAADTLYRNDGDGTFTDVSETSGIRKADKLYGFQPVWTDLDLDGDLDVFVANDSTPNFLWRNNGGQFVEEALLMGIAYNQGGRAQANMGVAVADFDQDGTLDIYSTNFSDDYHVLYQNSAAAYLLDVTFTAKIAQATFRYLGFGALLEDFDNDGLVDVFAANGHIYPQVAQHGLGSEYEQSNQLFRNLGKSVFEDVTVNAGPGLQIVKSTRGAVPVDFDRDGDLDLVLTNMDNRADVLRNDSPKQHFLRIRLKGSGGNLDGIGARVEVKTPSGNQTRELHAGSSFLGSGEKVLHFGLGKHASADVTVVWPDGTRQEVGTVAADQVKVVQQ